MFMLVSQRLWSVLDWPQMSGMKDRHVVHHSCFTIYGAYSSRDTATSVEFSLDRMCFSDGSTFGTLPYSTTFFQI